MVNLIGECSRMGIREEGMTAKTGTFNSVFVALTELDIYMQALPIAVSASESEFC
jgi:hypothetical protein